MSHLRERKEKNCLNCNAELQGRYCHVCGQENIETKETVWHLISHFFQDITHFDGKFFITLKYMVLKPGFVSMEYMLGRRASYVNPVRMYIFTSAFFFLIFFSLFKVDESNVRTIRFNGKTRNEVAKLDSAEFADFTRALNREIIKVDTPMTRDDFAHYADTAEVKVGFFFKGQDYSSREAYDSALALGKVHHNWFQRQLKYKEIEINKKAEKNPDQVVRNFLGTLLHSLPQMFFISLPLFALMLQLLYSRHKEYYYVNHSIFSIHFYIFSFIIMLVMFGLGNLSGILGDTFVAFTELFIFLGILFYLYKAMHRFYRQRRAKTIFKFLVLCLAILIIIMILLTIFVFFSFFKI